MTDKVAAPGESQVVGPEIESQVIASSPRHTRIIGLDGVRGVGCLAVVVAHVTVNYAPTIHDKAMIGMLGLALILFFALSGFLLFLPYVRRLTADASSAKMPSTTQYALHRVLRVFPGYLVIFLVCNFVFGVAYLVNPTLEANGTDQGTGMITDPWQLLANLTLIQTYIPEYIQTGINPSWSLTLEIAFYVTLPLLGLLLFRLRKRTAVRPLLLACLAPAVLLLIGVVGRLLAPLVVSATHVTDLEAQNWGPNWAAVYLRSFLTNADIFAFGMLAAILFVAMEQGVVQESVSKRVRMYTVLGLFTTLVLALKLSADQSPFATMAIGLVSGLLIHVIVAPLARGADSALARWLDFKPFHYAGVISLSIYLWHYPVLVLLGRYGLTAGDSWPGALQNVALVLAVTIALATLTYYLVERPALNSAKLFRRKSV
jgi:peptidoglycan/LPS O-acetylase OafA/YrhL